MFNFFIFSSRKYYSIRRNICWLCWTKKNNSRWLSYGRVLADLGGPLQCVRGVTSLSYFMVPSPYSAHSSLSLGDIDRDKILKKYFLFLKTTFIGCKSYFFPFQKQNRIYFIDWQILFCQFIISLAISPPKTKQQQLTFNQPNQKNLRLFHWNDSADSFLFVNLRSQSTIDIPSKLTSFGFCCQR